MQILVGDGLQIQGALPHLSGPLFGEAQGVSLLQVAVIGGLLQGNFLPQPAHLGGDGLAPLPEGAVRAGGLILQQVDGLLQPLDGDLDPVGNLLEILLGAAFGQGGAGGTGGSLGEGEGPAPKGLHPAVGQQFPGLPVVKYDGPLGDVGKFRGAVAHGPPAVAVHHQLRSQLPHQGPLGALGPPAAPCQG